MIGSALNQLLSVVKAALVGLRQGAALHSLSIGIIALSLTALGAFAILVVNINRVASQWGRDLTVTAFLKPDASHDDVENLRARAAHFPGALDAVHIDRKTARTRLMQALGERADLLTGLEDRVIPAAIEVELIPGSPGDVGEQIAAMLRAEPIVEDVAWGAEELGRLGAVVNILDIAGGLLGSLIALVTILVISNTLKLTILARREEIQIMKLVGASDFFVRAPFLLEGATQGLAGAGIAAGVLLGLHSTVALEVERVLSNAFGPMSLGGTPWDVVTGLLVLGTALGVLGGLVGVGRFLRV